MKARAAPPLTEEIRHEEGTVLGPLQFRRFPTRVQREPFGGPWDGHPLPKGRDWEVACHEAGKETPSIRNGRDHPAVFLALPHKREGHLLVLILENLFRERTRSGLR